MTGIEMAPLLKPLKVYWVARIKQVHHYGGTNSKSSIFSHEHDSIELRWNLFLKNPYYIQPGLDDQKNNFPNNLHTYTCSMQR
jgi:hypothetical protein